MVLDLGEATDGARKGSTSVISLAQIYPKSVHPVRQAHQ